MTNEMTIKMSIKKSTSAAAGQSNNKNHSFSTNTKIDLKKEFPMTFRRAFKKSFWLFVLFLVGLRVVISLEQNWIPTLTESEAVKARLGCNIAIVVLFLAWLTNFIYFQVERYNYEYLVSGGNLYVKKGLFVKQTGSFPLSRITDIYLHRGWGDYFWGLSSLHISTPTSSSGEFAYIHGLSIADAEKLQQRLEQLLKHSDQQIEQIGGMVGNLAKRGRRSMRDEQQES